MILLFIFAILLLFIILLVISKFNIDSDIYFNRSSIHLRILVKCILFKFSFSVFKLEKNILFRELFRAKKPNNNIEKKMIKKKKKKLNIRFILRLVRSVVKTIQLQKFYLRLVLGTGDAANSAMLCGLVYAVAGTVVGISSGFMKEISNVKIESTPDFTKDIFKGDFSCIFFVKTADIISSVFSNLILRRVK